jgi:methionine synthase II (cobalamin-independent)
MTVHAPETLARSRVDHVGSLLRPEQLKIAFRSHAEGLICAQRKTRRSAR